MVSMACCSTAASSVSLSLLLLKATAFVPSPSLPTRQRPRLPHRRQEAPAVYAIKDELRCCGLEKGTRRRRSRRNPELSRLGASGGNSPPLEVLRNDNARVRRNLERIRQVERDDTKTIRAITSSALRGKLRLSGRDKRGRVFLPRDPAGGSLETLRRMLKETFPLGDFPVALYVKTSLGEDDQRSMLTSDEGLLGAVSWAEGQGLDLNVFLDVHPDYEEEEAPEWLVDVPDPDSAPEWEMLSFYRFVDIDQPEAFANMLQLAWAPLGVRGRVYVAKEGVNAQMAVPCTSTERFERAVEAVEKLAGV
ncbi:unnamed protein product [Ectocarpus fasciculatus]